MQEINVIFTSIARQIINNYYNITIMAGMKKKVFLIIIVCLVNLATSCSNADNRMDVPKLEGIISSYNEFDGAMLSFLEEDMTKAGFEYGDIITLSIDDKEFVIPYYDGYYTRSGEYLCVAYPGYSSISFTAANTGLPKDLLGLEGHKVTISMKEKGGSLDVQQALGMKYTNERGDYQGFSDAEFANARVVTAGKIAAGKLYRCSSPFSNGTNRAYYVSEYLESQGAKTVLNLADTKEKMLTYEMPTYSRKLWDEDNVILCPLKSDPTADDYNNQLIAALKELPSHSAPYVVHCVEGKDRTGYVCALLEGLCGATYEEMVNDYLITYYNYYKISPEKDGDVCNTLLSLKLNPCLMFYAGVSSEAELPKVDYVKAFSNYLLSHGMTSQQLEALIQSLTANSF